MIENLSELNDSFLEAARLGIHVESACLPDTCNAQYISSTSWKVLQINQSACETDRKTICSEALHLLTIVGEVSYLVLPKHEKESWM